MWIFLSPTGFCAEENAAAPVVRGPVPRERSIQTKNACRTEAVDVF